MAEFIERRKQYRLPFEEKILFTDGTRSFTSYASNISRGGLFVTSLDPYPIQTQGYMTFFIPGQPASFCARAKVVHIVFDRQRCEVENGMGFMFEAMDSKLSAALDQHLDREQQAYVDLKKALQHEQPDSSQVAKLLKRIPHLRRHDLLALRYRVNRICTLFEATPTA